jgi:UDP-N-acetylmuramate dehydrogenase
MDLTEAIGVIADAAVRLSCKTEFDARLSDYTTFKIGGKVPLLVNICSIDALICILKLIAVYKVPFLIIGNGSNIIADDAGVNMIILRMNGDFAAIKCSEHPALYLDCQAGALLSSACRVAQRYALSGLEPLFGIPGSVGGAICMNAGAYGREMADLVESVNVLTKVGTEKVYSASECLFSYRESIFLHNGEIVTGVKLKLTPGDSERIKSQMESYTTRRREKQPLEYPSAGSTFKRPIGAYASALIDECGLKGLTIGGAQVSEKHAGFIINKGGAVFSDVIALMQRVIGIVEFQKGFQLEPEPIIISDSGVVFNNNGKL